LHRSDAPPELDGIVARCLEKTPEARYSSCLELHQDLERFIQFTQATVTSSDLAQVVQRLLAAEVEPAQQLEEPEQAEGLEPTSPSRPSSGPTSSPVEHPPPPARASAAPPVVGRRRGALGVGLVLVALLGGVAAWALLRELSVPAEAARPLVPAERGPPSEVGPVPAVDAGLGGSPQVVSGPPAAPARTPAESPPRPARLELRIRPYATVYLDGRRLGETPLPAQQVPPGKHTLRLVNEKLGKDVVIELTLHSGANLYKHNLKE
jgi:serine/threonine-protein kinase